MPPPARCSSDTVSDLVEAECEELPPITVTSAVGKPCAPAAAPAPLARSDSKGKPAPPPLRALLAAGSPPSSPLLDLYARAALPARLAARTLKRLAAVTLQGEERGAASEAAVWLCLVQFAAERRTLSTLRATRAAQMLLEEAPDGVAAGLLGALQEPRERLCLADALRGGEGGAALTASLEAGALAALDARGASSQAERCLRLQLEGRARARGAPVLPFHARAGDSVQVLAATAKLHMLFPASGNSDEGSKD